MKTLAILIIISISLCAGYFKGQKKWVAYLVLGIMLAMYLLGYFN